jgi:AcrR family transcriptional regulator
MGSIERRERAREETRSRILDAARELFVEIGFEAVTMRKIAERIEYTPTALYFHFKDKAALLKALCEEDFLKLAAKVAELDRVVDPIERLRRMGHAYIDFALENPNQYRFMFMTPFPVLGEQPAGEQSAGEQSAEQGAIEHDPYAFLKVLVERAIESGCIRLDLQDPELLAQTLWAGIHGVVALHIAKGMDPSVAWSPLKRRVRTMIDLLVRGILAPSAAVGPKRTRAGEKRR